MRAASYFQKIVIIGASSILTGRLGLHCRLYGLTGSQTWRYYRLFPKDFAFHKALVSVSALSPYDVMPNGRL